MSDSESVAPVALPCRYCTAGQESHRRRCPGIIFDGYEVRRCAKRRAHAGVCEYRRSLQRGLLSSRARAI